MTTALLDRLLPHSHMVDICGNSFRMREHTELRQAFYSDDREKTSAR